MLRRAQSDPESVGADLKVRAGSKTFFVHTYILTNRMDFFANMLKHRMQESTTGIVNLFQVENENAVWQLFFYVYTSRFDSPSVSVLSDLFVLADQFCFQSLMDAILRQLREVCNVHNAIEIFHVTECPGSTIEFQEFVFTFILSNLKHIVEENEDFKESGMTIDEFVLELLWRWGHGKHTATI